MTVVGAAWLLAFLAPAGFVFGRQLALHRSALTGAPLQAQANYYGYYAAWLVGASALLGAIVALLLPGDGVGSLAFAAPVAAALGGGAWAYRSVTPVFRARAATDRFVQAALGLFSIIALVATAGIILSLLFESLMFFRSVSIFDFLTGLQWSPQTALRVDQSGQSGAFGAVPVFAGTALIMLVAISIAGPLGLLIAIYLSEYADRRVRAVAKPVIEVLAGIPTVVYGFFALLIVGPAIRSAVEAAGFEAPTQSALAAGSVMGVMIIPFVSSLADDVITAVPQGLRDASFALGATRFETVSQVVVPTALPGVFGALLLAVSRAIGETMIVVMAAGRAANLTLNPLESVTTVTVQIVSLLTGDQEFDSAKTLSAFALGLVMFLATLALNIVALRVVHRYRERYD